MGDDFSGRAGEEFELLVSKKMAALGWECQLTPASNDFGADVICSILAEKIVIQCKCYDADAYVGVGAVQEANGARSHYEAQIALVVYSGRATKNAKILAVSTGVELLQISDIQPGCKYDRTAMGRNIQRDREIARQRQEEQSALEARRDAITARQESIKSYEIQHPQWTKNYRKHKALKVISKLSIAIPLIFIGSGDVGIAVLAVLGFAFYAFIWTYPGIEPVDPEGPAGSKPIIILPTNARATAAIAKPKPAMIRPAPPPAALPSEQETKSHPISKSYISPGAEKYFSTRSEMLSASAPRKAMPHLLANANPAPRAVAGISNQSPEQQETKPGRRLPLREGGARVSQDVAGHGVGQINSALGGTVSGLCPGCNHITTIVTSLRNPTVLCKVCGGRYTAHTDDDDKD